MNSRKRRNLSAHGVLNRKRRHMPATEVLLALGGGGAIVAGLSSWIGKLWADRLLERERALSEKLLESYKRELDLSFSSKNRASAAEFEIYRQLWSEVAHFTTLGLGIRSGLAKSSGSEEEQGQRYRDFQSALQQFQLSYQSHKPFYAPAVYEAISHLANCISLENKMAFGHRDLDGMALATSRMEGVVPILEASEAVCQAIRNRLYPSEDRVATRP